ncbi:MAG: phytoene desaturase family protein [Spirochaetia bacterium]
MSKKVIVIGAGFAGLTSAALLARKGYQVTVLEKNKEVGGRARIYQEKGFTFDMGPSWYLMPEVFDEFFARFGKKREDYYTLKELDTYYQVFFSPDESVLITKDKEHNRSVFDSFEQDGGKKLDEYLEKAKYKYDIAMNEFLYKEYTSVFQFLNKKMIIEGTKLNIFSNLDKFVQNFFKDRKARQILEYAMVFLGNSPQNAPALYSIMSHVDLNLGVFFPEGGMGGVALGLQRLAEEEGATVLTGEPVTEIQTKKGKVSKVITSSNEYEADIVVNSADYPWSETKLLEKKNSTYSERYWKKKVLAPSMFILYLGIGHELETMEHHNLYFSEDWTEHFDMIFNEPGWPEDPCFYLSCITKTDPSFAPKACENVFVLVPLAPGLEDTDEIRQIYADKMIDHIERVTGEQIKDDILVKRIYSHRDFASDYNAWEGTALGISHTLDQTAVFRPAHKSKKVENLYYTGQYTHPGVGVPMTFIASQIVADQINGK